MKKDIQVIKEVMMKKSYCNKCIHCYIAENETIGFCDENKWFMANDELYEENIDGECCEDYKEVGECY